VVFWKINDVIICNVMKILSIICKYPVNINYFNKNIMGYAYGVFMFISFLILIEIYIYKKNSEKKYEEENNFILYII
jgi:hypothetical protein